MKFKEVLYSDLKLGSKYLIMHSLQFKDEKNDRVYIGRFNGYCNKYTFREISYWGKTYITYLTNFNKKYLVGDVSFNRYSDKKQYLILDSQIETIQNNMEARALNIIIRTIIGDNNFSYHTDHSDDNQNDYKENIKYGVI